jgi:hypothetical protein
MTRTRIAAITAAAFFAVGSVGLAACSDVDDDGGTTDEEIQEGEDTVDSIGGELEEEVDAQDEGSNEDNE